MNESRSRFRQGLAAAVLAVTTVGSLVACGSDDEGSSGSSSDSPLVVGATPVPHAEILQFVIDEFDANIEIREFTDYNQPNQALVSGDIDANYFQHQPFLDEFLAGNPDADLVSVAAVHIEPLGVYSSRVDSLDDLPDGATIGIPNDPSNSGRALALLAAEGLIELAEGAGTSATEQDIVSNPRNLSFEPLEAAQLPRSLEDLDAAVINGNYALEADLNPAEDALALESGEDNPYANLLVVNAEDADDPRVRELADLLTSPEVAEFIENEYSGSVLPVVAS